MPDPDGWYVQYGGNASDLARFGYDNYGQIRGDTPVVADCVWVDTWPFPYAAGHAPATTMDLYFPNVMGHSPQNFMRRMTIDRHGMAVNVGFADTHVDHTKLESLWTLRWGKDWEINRKVPMPPQRP